MSFAARLPSALAGALVPPFFSVNVSGGLGAPMVCTLSRPDSGAKPGACAVNVHAPVRRPMIEKRPLSSVVAVKLLGDALGFSAVIDAPLIGCPASSFTVPPTRPVWAAAGPASAATNSIASAIVNTRTRSRMVESSPDWVEEKRKVQYILNPVKLAGTIAAIGVAAFSIGADAGLRAAQDAARDARGFESIAPLVEAAIARHELPGAIVLAGEDDAIVYHAAFG